MRRERWDALLQRLQEAPGWLIAFSGGADSTLLLEAANASAGQRPVLAVTAVSASLAAREKRDADALARRIGVPHLWLYTDELANPRYAANPSNRCFFCKDELFSRLAPLARERGLRIADGYNVSDRGDIRPGLDAARQWNVAHPLDDAGIDKSDIRVLSRWRKLPTWNKPASPCLSSRLPYGTTVTPERLLQVERAEDVLRAEGFRTVRVRYYGAEARIEVPLTDLTRLRDETRWGRVEKEIQSCGFEIVSVDPRGFLSGRLNTSSKK